MSGRLANNVSWMLDIPYTCESGGASAADCSGGVDDAWTSESVMFQAFIPGANPVRIDGTDYIILYGGKQWGYTYSSVDTPEPAFGLAAGCFAIVLARVRRRQNK